MGLRRTSSLVIGSPTKSSAPVRRPVKVSGDDEVIPDSDEENNKARVPQAKLQSLQIIELSSGSDDDFVSLLRLPTKKAMLDDPFLSSPEKPVHTSVKVVIEDSESGSDVQPHYIPQTKPNKSSWSRRTVMSGSEEDDSGIEQAADSNDNNDDGAILILDDPPSSRKPHPRLGTSPAKLKSKRPAVPPAIQATMSGGNVIIADPSPLPTTVLPRTPVPARQALLPDYFTPVLTSPTKGKTQTKAKAKGTTKAVPIAAVPSIPTTAPRRMTKKAVEEQKQAQLAAYAQALFDELNDSVFKSHLPKDTALVWNKKLQTTAGRATWHINSQRVETTSIELATKVLDCEERIRNTLSHEMCHLACWVINRKPKENHGDIWTGWADEVMEKRPDIVITTKHSYDITYKFEWQCQNTICNKIYGRHSKSIDPGKSICGVCKTGDLLPLFQTRTRKTKADSKMAAGKPRDSPSTLDNLCLCRPPQLSQATIKASDLGSSSKSKVPTSVKGKSCVSEGDIEHALGKLVTRMSFIDLTDD